MAPTSSSEAIPIHVTVSHDTYVQRQGLGTIQDLVDGRPCPAEGCAGRLGLTGTVVSRGLVRLVAGADFVYGPMDVALAACDGPRRHWRRVLPADVLPGKTYTVAAQEAPEVRYLAGGGGLRTVLGAFRGERPHHTTLWGWLNGLGRYALGRATTPEGIPAAPVREETRRRHLLDMDALWAEPVEIDPARYRSEARLEDLEAAARWLRLARAVAPTSPSPLAAWCILTAACFAVATMGWWARFRTTPIQHRGRPAAVVASPSECPWPTRTRSPPGVTN